MCHLAVISLWRVIIYLSASPHFSIFSTLISDSFCRSVTWQVPDNSIVQGQPLSSLVHAGALAIHLLDLLVGCFIFIFNLHTFPIYIFITVVLYYVIWTYWTLIPQARSHCAWSTWDLSSYSGERFSLCCPLCYDWGHQLCSMFHFPSGFRLLN